MSNERQYTPQEYQADRYLSDGREVEKMVVYKEHDERRPDVGKFRIYCQVGEQKMSRTMSQEDLSAYFDRRTTPSKLVEKNFGEQLHLASFYNQFRFPEGANVEQVLLSKSRDGNWWVQADLGEKGLTSKHVLTWNDKQALFSSKTATKEQLAARYLSNEIKEMIANQYKRSATPMDEVVDRKWYSSVVYLQPGEEGTQFLESMASKGKLDALLSTAEMYDQGDEVDLEHTDRFSTHYTGDRVVAENDNYAVVVNNSVGGSVEIFRKVSENDVRIALEHQGYRCEDIHRGYSDDVMDLANQMREEIAVVDFKRAPKGKENTLADSNGQSVNNNNQKSKAMSKTKKQPVKQEDAAQVKQDAQPVEKTASEKNEQKTEQTDKEVRQPRPPQLITVNGDKVSHAHAFRSNNNPENMFFTAKINGEDLKPRLMSAEDVKAYHDKTISVSQLMEKYYPTKLMPKVTPEEFKAADTLSDGRKIEKFHVYKEDNAERKDVGKYKLYALVGNLKLVKTMSPDDVSAFFDRVTTPKELVEKNFGETLNLASAYEKYNLPEGVKPESISVRKSPDGDWLISADLGEKGRTEEHKLSRSDLYSLFNAKTATKEQLAGKYLTEDVSSMKSAVKQEQSKGLKVG